MKLRIKQKTLIALTVAALIALAVTLTGRNGPADAQSISVIQGRYQFIDLGKADGIPGDHIAIFDTETGVLREWIGKKDGEFWTYSAAEGREVLRRTITVR